MLLIIMFKTNRISCIILNNNEYNKCLGGFKVEEELLKEYNNLFKLFLLANSRIQEFKIYLKMKKTKKNK